MLSRLTRFVPGGFAVGLALAALSLSGLFRRCAAAVVGLPLVLLSLLTLPCSRGARGLSRGWAAQDDSAPPPAITRDARWGTHRTVEANGQALHIVEAGDPRKPLLLLLHGFPECWYSWRWWLASPLRETHHVVAYDARGYGESGAPAGGSSWGGSAAFAVRHLAADAAALVRALGHERATLAAHDWGVPVAWAAAGLLEARGALEGLIVINGPHIGAYNATAGLPQYVKSLYIAAFQVPLLAELLLSREDGRLIGSMFLGKKMGVRRREGPRALGEADVEVFKWGLRRGGGAGLTRALNWYRQLPDESRADFAAAAPRPARPLRARCLALWGVDDGALGTELLGGMEAYAPRTKKVLLENCSHWAMQDVVEDVLEEVQAWLREEAPSSKGGNKAV